MSLGVVGSRNFSDYELLEQKLQECNQLSPIKLIVSGGAKGADQLSERFAKENNIETLIFYPDWDKHGKRAGPIRNKQIIQHSDKIVAFWDGYSRGTKSSIDLAEKYNKPLEIVYY